jgi:hypothetical protein
MMTYLCKDTSVIIVVVVVVVVVVVMQNVTQSQWF